MQIEGWKILYHIFIESKMHDWLRIVNNEC